MESLRVNLKEKSYNISFHSDFSSLPEAMKSIGAPKKLLIVTDTNVEKLYLQEVKEILRDAGYDVNSFAFSAGEENKNINTITDICRSCLENKLDRKSMIVALGGGVVGDMAGFAASIYMRGIDFVQVPTTLLSQSDSSVGGKTGIDFCGAKNILGAFLQPKHVYINVSTVKTLPEREIISGMGEVIKHGIIRDNEFFKFLYENREAVKKLDDKILLSMCRRNCEIKAAVVEADEKESGERAHLNFGHTIGHAVESASDFSLTHGSCVALGMLGAFYIAEKRGYISKGYLAELTDILLEYGFDVRTKIADRDKILGLMRSDKKSASGTIRFVLPTGYGKVGIFSDVTDEEIISAIKYISL